MLWVQWFKKISLVTLLGLSMSTIAALPDSLTLEQVWQLLEQRNLSLKQQQLAIERAVAIAKQAQTLRWPTLQAGGSYKYISDIPSLEFPPTVPGFQFPRIEAGAHNQYDVFVQVVQPIFTGLRLTNTVRLQQTRLQQTKIQAVRVRHQLLLQVGQLYYTVQLNRLQQAVLQTSLQRVQTALARARALYRAQQVTAFDTLRLANQGLRLRNQINNMQRQNTIIVDKLHTLLNVDSLPPLPQSIPPKALHLNSEVVYQQMAMQHRPELEEVRLRQKSALLSTRIAKAAFFPQFSAYAAVHYGNPGANFFKKEWNIYTLAGVQMSFDLWNWGRTQYRVQETTAQLQQLSLEEQKLVRNIQQEVHTVYLQLQQVIEDQGYLTQLVEQETLRYQLVQHKFKNGYATSLDLQEAESSLTAAQLQLQRNRIAWEQLQLQMAWVTGTIGKNLEENHE